MMEILINLEKGFERSLDRNLEQAHEASCIVCPLIIGEVIGGQV